MAGDEVLVRRDGNRVILEPLTDEPTDKNGWPIGFFTELRRLAKSADAPAIDALPVHFLNPKEIDPTIAWKR